MSPPTAAQALAAAGARLAAAGLPDPATDARRLLAHAMDLPADRLTLHLHDPLGLDAAARLDAALAARLRRQPIAQITGARLFWGRRFAVTRDVLDPRPETETLIEAALERPAAHVLDLGTGSGCILLTLLAEWPGARGIGLDASPTALRIACANSAALGVAARTRLVPGDWTQPGWTGALAGPFDLVVSNPPYIAADEMPALAPEVRDWEPGLALSPGGDGLGAYRAILPALAALLVPGGRALLEIGASQGPSVAALAAQSALEEIRLLRDLSGHERVLSVRNRMK